MRFLDEISIAPPGVVVAAQAQLSRLVEEGIGAVVEYELSRRTARPELPALAVAAPGPITWELRDLLEESPLVSRSSLSLQAAPYGLMRIPPGLRDDEGWVAFVQRARASARSAGCSDLVASAIAGAIEELADNVVQHSRAQATGLACFVQKPRRFEYVVADSGIGMLASLRESPDFHSVKDDLEALPLAITPGISRQGRTSGCGYGFRAVFAPLRGASGSVRLRSGAAALEMHGSASSRDHGVCSQRPHYQGVVVAGVLAP